MGVKQYEVGKKWEQIIMAYYKKRGYFTYKFPTENNGTICDILIAKNGSCMFIEAKHTINDKLYYKGCGLYKKRDELDNFVKKYNNNVYIMIYSDTLGVCWTTWLKARELFEKKGYLDLRYDCFKAEINESNITQVTL